MAARNRRGFDLPYARFFAPFVHLPQVRTIIDEVDNLKTRTLTARLFASYTEESPLVALVIRVSTLTKSLRVLNNALYLDTTLHADPAA